MNDATETSPPWTLLTRALGRWEGEETMPPAPWAPDGVQARAVHETRAVLDGTGIVTEYTQTVGDEVSVRSVTLIRWNGEAERFVLHHFAGEDEEPTVLHGARDGDRLVFEGEAAWGRVRQTMAYGAGRQTIVSETPGEDGAWTRIFSGSYRRTAGDSSSAPSGPGSVGWLDLTVDDAPRLRDFYAAVTGWTPEGVAMDGYEDFTMKASDGAAVAGVCHARGGNAGLPPVWLPYVVVEDLGAALEAVEEQGGVVVKPAAAMGEARWAVIRDPAGAALALYQPGAVG